MGVGIGAAAGGDPGQTGGGWDHGCGAAVLPWGPPASGGGSNTAVIFVVGPFDRGPAWKCPRLEVFLVEKKPTSRMGSRSPQPPASFSPEMAKESMEESKGNSPSHYSCMEKSFGERDGRRYPPAPQTPVLSAQLRHQNRLLLPQCCSMMSLPSGTTTIPQQSLHHFSMGFHFAMAPAPLLSGAP